MKRQSLKMALKLKDLILPNMTLAQAIMKVQSASIGSEALDSEPMKDYAEAMAKAISFFIYFIDFHFISLSRED